MANDFSSVSGPWERLVAIMATLRGPEGCPWDREQTHQSLKPYLIEETYEVLEALDSGDQSKFCEELGDLLLQVVFHARLAQEAGQFNIDQVITAICEKLVRRHPHVFGEVKVNGAAEVVENWERIKERERPEQRASALDGVVPGLPALLKAQELQDKAAQVGFDWGDLQGPLRKVEEEFREFEAVLDQGNLPQPQTQAWERLEDEFGDILFALVNVGRFLNIYSELALERTNAKFTQRFKYIEQQAARNGRLLSNMTLAEMEELWQQAKGQE